MTIKTLLNTGSLDRSSLEKRADSILALPRALWLGRNVTLVKQGDAYEVHSTKAVSLLSGLQKWMGQGGIQFVVGGLAYLLLCLVAAPVLALGLILKKLAHCKDREAQSYSKAVEHFFAQRTHFQKLNQNLIAALLNAETKATGALGGHGNFRVAEVTVGNNNYSLFLKPFDEVEFANFKFIQEQLMGQEESSILKFMPRVYGSIDREVDGKMVKFMVMENLRQNSQGKWKQIADLKITRGGQYDPEELAATGRDQKTRGTALVMDTQAKIAGDFLTVTTNKAMRTLGAGNSQKAFQNKILKATKQVEVIRDLEKQFAELVRRIERSPMAFIGASIFVYQNESFKIYLADPAHGRADPTKFQEQAHLFFGNEADFRKRLKNNCDSIKAMQAAVSRSLESIQNK